MKRNSGLRSFPTLILIACASLLLIQCGEDTVAPPKSCEDIGDAATRSAPNQGDPVFKVISPNGGETYKVGDSITVKLGSNAAGTSALAYLIVGSGATTKRLRLPGTPSNRDVNPRVTCEVSFRIPESIVESGVTFSLVSDAVKVRVAAYNSETLYFDESDATFRIIP
jgi:hypothetical protein